MKVYITKYALTQGIFKRDAEICEDINTKMISVIGNIQEYYHKPYWHETLGAAREHAESMRLKRIQSLHKQIQKLIKMTFDEVKG